MSRLAESETGARNVSVSGLHKSFGGTPALCGVDLEVPAGSITAVLGPSGSGKTTLLRVLAGFSQADAGTVVVGGRTMDGPGHHVPPAERRIGYVPQEGALFPHLDVGANIGFGLARGVRRARVRELLELTGMGGLKGRYPHELSGGQQQRVALARALATNPSLVLLDEPFSSLDAMLRASVRRDVMRILREASTTVVLVTHDQDEALSLADEVAVLTEGTIAQVGPPEEIYRHPLDSALASFVGEANLLPGRMRGGVVETRLGPLELAPGAAIPPDGNDVVVLVRPEQVLVALAGEHASRNGTSSAPPDAAHLPGVVLESDFHGHDALMAIETSGDVEDGEDSVPVLLRARCLGSRQLEPGTAVTLTAEGAVTVWAAEAARSRGELRP